MSNCCRPLVSRRLAGAKLALLFVVLLVFLMRAAHAAADQPAPTKLSSRKSSETGETAGERFRRAPNTTAGDDRRQTQQDKPSGDSTGTSSASNSSNPDAANQVAAFPLYMRLLATLSCLVIFTVGVCGNLLVPLVVIKTKYLRNSTNLFLINLSVADLLVLIVCMPTVLIELHSRPETWLLGESMCKLSNFIEMFAANGSIFTILAISFERYYAICKPLKAGYKCTRLRATIIICLVWLLSTLLTLPILIMAKSSETSYIDGSLVYNCILETDLGWHKWYVFISFVAFFCLPLLVLMLVYWLISRRLIRENVAMLGAASSPAAPPGHARAHHQLGQQSVPLALGHKLLVSEGRRPAQCSRSVPAGSRRRGAPTLRSIRLALFSSAEQRHPGRGLSASAGAAARRASSQLPAGGECPASAQSTPGAGCERRRLLANKSLSLDQQQQQRQHHHHLHQHRRLPALNGNSLAACDANGASNANPHNGRERVAQPPPPPPPTVTVAAAAADCRAGKLRPAVWLIETCRYLAGRLRLGAAKAGARVAASHLNQSAMFVAARNQESSPECEERTGSADNQTVIESAELNSRQMGATDDERDQFDEPFLSARNSSLVAAAIELSGNQCRVRQPGAPNGATHSRPASPMRPLEGGKQRRQQQPPSAGSRFKFQWTKGLSVSSSTGDSSAYTNSTCLTEARRSASPTDTEPPADVVAPGAVIAAVAADAGPDDLANRPYRPLANQCWPDNGSSSDTSRTKLLFRMRSASNSPTKQRKRPPGAQLTDGDRLADDDRSARRQRVAAHRSLSRSPCRYLAGRTDGQADARPQSPSATGRDYSNSASSSPDFELFRKGARKLTTPTSDCDELNQVRSSSTSLPSSSDLVSSSDSSTAPGGHCSASGIETKSSTSVNTSTHINCTRASDRKPAVDHWPQQVRPAGSQLARNSFYSGHLSKANKPSRGISFKLNEEDETKPDDLINLVKVSPPLAADESASSSRRADVEARLATPDFAGVKSSVASNSTESDQQAKSTSSTTGVQPGQCPVQQANSVQSNRVGLAPREGQSSGPPMQQHLDDEPACRRGAVAAAGAATDEIDDSTEPPNRLLAIANREHRREEQRQLRHKSLMGPLDGFAKLNLVSIASTTFQQNFRRFGRRSGSQPLVCPAGHLHCRSVEQHATSCQLTSHCPYHQHQKGLVGHGRLVSDLLVVRDLSKKQQMDARRQVVMMLAFVVACFFLLFFPYRVFTIWLIMSTEDQVQSLGMETYYNLTYFSRILIYLHSAINPIAYNLISTKFRRAFMSVLLCRGSATRRHFTTEPHHYHNHANQRLSGPHQHHLQNPQHPQQQQQQAHFNSRTSGSGGACRFNNGLQIGKKRSLQIA